MYHLMPVRFGQLQDSSVVATRLGKSVRYLVAAPRYLKGRKLPTEPAELQSLDCVMLSAKNQDQSWLPLFCKTAQGWKMQKR